MQSSSSRSSSGSGSRRRSSIPILMTHAVLRCLAADSLDWILNLRRCDQHLERQTGRTLLVRCSASNRYQAVLMLHGSRVSADAVSEGNASIPSPGGDAAAVNRIALAATLLGTSSSPRSDTSWQYKTGRQSHVLATPWLRIPASSGAAPRSQGGPGFRRLSRTASRSFCPCLRLSI